MYHTVHFSAVAGKDPKKRLLDAAIEHIASRGVSDLSLRELAAAIGTSHRMLIYHFGSRDGLLAAVVARIEADQRAALTALIATAAAPEADHAPQAARATPVAAPAGDPLAIGRTFWQHLTDGTLAPAERLFFEIYAQALRDPAWAGAFRAAVIDAWERPLTEMFAAMPQARVRARLSVAVIRGLLLDLLLTGDRDVLDEANDLFSRLITASFDV